MEIATNGNLIKESKQLHLSTQSNAGTLKNGDKRSCIEYYVPNFIQHDDSIEYIQYSVQSAIIPVSFYTINDNHNSLILVPEDSDVIGHCTSNMVAHIMNLAKNL